MDEKQIQKLMKNLGISREEAIQVINDDKAIDKGEKLFELDEAGKEAEKKYARADRKKAEVHREKKVNNDKLSIIQSLIDAVGVEVSIINPEREFTFTIDNKKYKVVLSCPRS